MTHGNDMALTGEMLVELDPDLETKVREGARRRNIGTGAFLYLCVAAAFEARDIDDLAPIPDDWARDLLDRERGKPKDSGTATTNGSGRRRRQADPDPVTTDHS